MNTRLPICLVLLTFIVAACAASPTVTTTYGPVTGSSAEGVRVFRGIPFAAPPVGDLRWKPPVPPVPWTASRAATEFGPACPQPPDKIVALTGAQSEDCLYLNVWSPERANQLPVMVFIHGGGFRTGAGSATNYDSPALAQHGAVLVTINYRLGNFGFLCHPALAAESQAKTCGNYGLMDQIMALHWVHDNIAAFGGDPHCVTIFGESAGAVSVGLLMASPPARGLFQRAIMESGSVPPHLKTAQELQEKGLALQRQLGVGDGPDVLAKLRQVPAEKLITEAGPSSDRLPGASIAELLCVDGEVLTEEPAAVFVAGRQAPVPLIAGSNRDEGTLWSRRLPIRTVAQWQAALRYLLKDNADAAAQLYSVQSDADVPKAVDELVGEAFTAGARRAVRWTQPVQPNVYLYHFTHAGFLAERAGYGAFHGSELSYVFGKSLARLPMTAAERQLSEQVVGYWTRFAAAGDPNGNGALTWPRYTQQTDEYLALDLVPTVGDHLRTAQCDFWDKVQGL